MGWVIAIRLSASVRLGKKSFARVAPKLAPGGWSPRQSWRVRELAPREAPARPAILEDRQRGNGQGTTVSPATEELFMSTENKTLAEGGTLTYVTRFDGVRVPATDH